MSSRDLSPSTSARTPKSARPEADKPLAIDLFCGLGGWTEGLLAEGYRVRGYDIEAHEYGEERYPAELVLKSILDLHGSELADADLIVASPPCQEVQLHGDAVGPFEGHGRRDPGRHDWQSARRTERPLRRLLPSPARGLPGGRAAHSHGGRERASGAQPWIGRAPYNYGSYYLWGDVPALMPRPQGEGVKVGGMGWYPPEDPRHQVGAAFNPGAQGAAFAEAREGRKVAGFRFDGAGGSFQTASVRRTAPGQGARLKAARARALARNGSIRTSANCPASPAPARPPAPRSPRSPSLSAAT
jgi:hypothetical protein